MIKIKVLSVRNPRWVAGFGGNSIECLIRTNTLLGEVPFVASAFDPEPHGRDVFARCLAGEFGEIAPMVLNNAPVLVRHAKGDIVNQRFEKFLTEANLENGRRSSRSVVIVWGAFLDELLDQLLESNEGGISSSNSQSKRTKKTFDNRIKSALERRIITEEEAGRCHHIRQIRNAAAHEWDLSLESDNLFSCLHALYQADHSDVFVFHKDKDFLIQLIYAGSCAILAMKFLTRLQQWNPN